MSALKRVLITGGSGLLGQYLNVELSENYELLTTYNHNIGNTKDYRSVHVDITDFSKLKDIFDGFHPDVVIHTASVSNNELASQMSEDSVVSINVVATEEIARLCEKYRAKLLYTSTDLVYDGENGPFLSEDANIKPVSLYAKSKFHGELRIRQIFDNFIILRVALLFGNGLNHSMNHFQKMYQALKQNKPVNLFYDQFRSPLSLYEAARIFPQLISKDISGQIFNFGGLQRVSRFDMGELLCKLSGLPERLLIRTSMFTISNLPKVPDVSMNTEKLDLLNIKRKDIEESMLEIIRNFE
jgi:dTDP-4-dehydrorhamnose reductase